jgi:hypothetical protein
MTLLGICYTNSCACAPTASCPSRLMVRAHSCGKAARVCSTVGRWSSPAVSEVFYIFQSRFNFGVGIYVFLSTWSEIAAEPASNTNWD